MKYINSFFVSATHIKLAEIVCKLEAIGYECPDKSYPGCFIFICNKETVIAGQGIKPMTVNFLSGVRYNQYYCDSIRKKNPVKHFDLHTLSHKHIFPSSFIESVIKHASEKEAELPNENRFRNSFAVRSDSKEKLRTFVGVAIGCGWKARSGKESSMIIAFVGNDLNNEPYSEGWNEPNTYGNVLSFNGTMFNIDRITDGLLAMEMLREKL